jgi:transcriptional regulator with XRE-family HTH domain
MATVSDRNTGGRPRERELSSLGQTLQNALSRKRMTVLQLEELSGVHRGTIYDIMDGDTKEPKASTLAKIATALGITIDKLLTDEPPKKRMRSA